jgi:hypothetical protein
LSYHAEKAFYYYLDYILKDFDMNDWRKQRKEFFSKLKEYAPNFLKMNPAQLAERSNDNKPVCGALIFNKDNNKVLVVRVGQKYGFPKGKQNQGETFEDCAIREVEEETGLNIANKLDSRIRIDFTNHEGKIFFFVARGVAEEERMKIDGHEID